jgi:hypothetical protein
LVTFLVIIEFFIPFNTRFITILAGYNLDRDFRLLIYCYTLSNSIKQLP